MQRVARYLYVRGQSYVFRRHIPPYARDEFGGRGEYFVTFEDVTERRALALRSAHEELTDHKIKSAKRKATSSDAIAQVFQIRRTPEQHEIERAVREWLLARETESSSSGIARSARREAAQDLGFLDAEIVRVMSSTEDTPLSTRWIADALIQANGWFVAPGKLRGSLEEAVARGQRELAARLRAEFTWGDQPSPTHRMFAPSEFERDHRTPVASAPVPIMTVFAGYCAEQEPKAATIKAWKSALTSLIAHLGHDDAAQVTSEDIINWKNALLVADADGKRQRGQYTVRHKYLGAVKPVFGWAVSNKLVAINPVLGVKIAVPRRVRRRAERGYTDEEAKIVLEASLAIDCSADKSRLARARRWLPWLCAYTGARGGDIALLRGEDVRRSPEGIWYLVITAEKNGQTRKVALHPHLVEQGFVTMARNKNGPIFYDPDLTAEANGTHRQHKKVAEKIAKWVRQLGIDDTELQPNHGWRHRFATIARHCGMDPDVRRAFIGHAADDEHQSYGDVLVSTSYEALLRFPRHEWPLRDAASAHVEDRNVA